ncbi:unnamed protein product [Spirodela intermedia]|uniref:Uncharacterized protein n=1 Tax=Spirodela intermedia TaxID=51605 RepID=A0A7I8JR70_SPIIN|nr:unnamed protein product [Spirodela intermedia]CAA6672265.1 unnamed protein product [Spirodela intermedia]
MMEKHGLKGRGEKREWEEEIVAAESNKRQKKVPALASVIVEAMKLDSLQRFCSTLEPLLRRIVSEEVERAIAKIGAAKLTSRSSPARIEGSGARNLRLRFSSRMPRHLFTGGKVEGDQGLAIHVVLQDADTGAVVSTGPESTAKLTVVVLQGDFTGEDDENWTAEHFESFEVKEREGKRPLLTGELQVALKAGVGTLGEFTFTDNSSWIKSRKFRLGAKVAGGGVRIREAKSEAFAVKDHRGALYKKHYPPALHDEVWRLNKIAKDGALHKKLIDARIYTVEDFLRLLVRDSHRLRTILGSGMSQKMWENMVEHAKTCVLSGKHYVYYADGSGCPGVVFNHICELQGLITGGQFLPIDSLTDAQKVSVDHLVKRAYDNWHLVVEYDGHVLVNSINLPTPPRGQCSALPGGEPLPVRGRRRRLPLAGRGLALAPPQTAAQGYGEEYEDFISEEEIRMRTSEILDNDDVQNLLSSFTMEDGGYHSYEDESVEEAQEEGGEEEEERRRSDREEGQRQEVLGWLKLKAAFRWVIFVRKTAAAKRARLEELD